MKFFTEDPIDNISALVQVMAWLWIGTMHDAITWTNVDQHLHRHMMPQSQNELSHSL